MKDSKLEQSFDQFARAVRNNGVFDAKTTALFHLAVAMTAGCDP